MMVAELWLALAAGFLAALLVLQWLPPPPASPSLSLAGLFHDLVRYGKTKGGCGQRPAWLQYFDVPKRKGSHLAFRMWGTWEPFAMNREANIHSQWEDFSDSVRDTMAKYPEALTILAGDLNARIGGRDDELIPLTLGAPDLVLPPPCLLSELGTPGSCFYMAICVGFLGGVIHVVQYCFGLSYYVLVGLTVLSQVPSSVRAGRGDVLMIRWYHGLGFLMFIWASVHQQRCLAILANLRKNKSGEVVSLDHSIPFGDWFEMVSCPHYFAEVLIYVSMGVTFGFKNLTWWLVVTYVLFNQAVSATLCHEFYLSNFKHYPKGRKAYIPFLF
ncbi:UNVERIFIED_CONTAM: hypothetical protein K2H54_055983 [Gekko kuhli]